MFLAFLLVWLFGAERFDLLDGVWRVRHGISGVGLCQEHGGLDGAGDTWLPGRNCRAKRINWDQIKARKT